MTDSDALRRDRARNLMMAAIDGEITAGERAELEALLAEAPDMAAEWRRFVRLKEVTAGMSLRQPPQEIWDHYWQSTYRRAERGIAWILVSAGVTVIAAFWLWQAANQLFRDASTPVAVRLGIGALSIGLAILLVSVIREKLFTSRRDPYQKEVIR